MLHLRRIFSLFAIPTLLVVQLTSAFAAACSAADPDLASAQLTTGVDGAAHHAEHELGTGDVDGAAHHGHQGPGHDGGEHHRGDRPMPGCPLLLLGPVACGAGGGLPAQGVAILSETLIGGDRYAPPAPAATLLLSSALLRPPRA